MKHLPCGGEADDGVPDAVVAKQAHERSPEADLAFEYVDGYVTVLKISLKTLDSQILAYMS